MYYTSIIVDEIEMISSKVEAKSIVGLDLKIKGLVGTSDGEEFSDTREAIRHKKKIKRLQRKLSRIEEFIS